MTVLSLKHVVEVLRGALNDTLLHNGPVFGASAVECGNYRSLDLGKAKTACENYLKILKGINEYQ